MQDAGNRSKRLLIIVLGIAFLGTTTVIGCKHGRFIRADYGDFFFVGRPEFFELTAQRENGHFAEIFIELEDGRRMLLGDLPEEDAAAMTDTPLGGYATVVPMQDVRYSHNFSMIRYRGDTLMLVSINTSELPIKISSNLDGPYVQLPITRRLMIKLFGEPKSWERFDRPGV